MDNNKENNQEKKSLKKTTNEQFEMLVNLINQNPEMGMGCQPGQTRQEVHDKWEDISIQLNSLGPPTRSIKEWKRVWDDKKRKVKEKLAKNKKSISATGGGEYFQYSLSPIEQTVSSILHLSKAANPDGICFGLPGNKTTTSEVTEIINLSSPKRKRNLPTLNENKLKGLKDQKIEFLEKQESVNTEFLKTVKEIKNDVHDMGSELRKIRKIKEEKLQLLKSKFIKDEKRNDRLEKIKQDELKLRQRKLRLQQMELKIRHDIADDDFDNSDAHISDGNISDSSNG